MFLDQSFDKAIEKIKESYHQIEEENKKLREENNRLKSENYKDEELKNMFIEKERLVKKCNHFGLEDKDYDEMMEWWNKHVNKKHKTMINKTEKLSTKIKAVPMVDYHFEIHETHIATCYTIKCDCGEHHDIFY